MATKTLGTNATTTLTALAFAMGYGSGMAAADIASINNAVKDDSNPAGYIKQGGVFTAGGQLFIPRRGVLQVLPGDWVGVDSQGWPILVSKNSITNGPWTHS